MSETELFLGCGPDGERLGIDRDDLTTHGLVLGRTGSGKSALLHVLVEEAVMGGASAIVLDPKGDLTNLLLAFPGLTPREFAPWVPAGKSPVDEARRWAEGLKASKQEVLRVAEWKNAATFRVFTPGLVKTGHAVSLLPSFDAPDRNEVSLREHAAHVVSTVMGSLGLDADALTDPRSVFLTELLMSSWKTGLALPLESWPAVVLDPPDELADFDGIALNDFLSRTARMKLAAAIVGFRRQAGKWLEGPTLDVGSLVVPGDDGRPKVTVFTLRHLSQDDRFLFVSLLLSKFVEWMSTAPASGRLRALLVLDEASGYLPPHPMNPPTKRPLSTLLAQGRSQGLGVLLATQNPADLDYKALSNVGTWFLGGLRERDLKRDLAAELENRGVQTSDLLSLPERTFMALTKDGKASPLRVRWTLSYLRGPIDLDDLERLSDPSVNLSVQPPRKIPRYEVNASRPKRGRVLYGFIELTFDLTDEDSLPQDMEIMFSVDGGKSWRSCSPAPESPPSKKLESSPAGVPHIFLWDSVRDLGLKFVPGVMTQVRAKGRNGVILPPADICNNCLVEDEADESWNVTPEWQDDENE